MELHVGDVVQFNEKHEWCGSLGIVTRVNVYDSDTRYMVGVPIPKQGTAYIFSMKSAEELEYIGEAIFVESDSEDE